MTNTKPRFPVPVTILTGFLGAGKTTLLNRILHGDHGLKIAVLVNDFGSINIDAALIVGVEGETINLANGCVCCTIRDDLLAETIKLLKRPDPPEYIILETSGVSDPQAVASTFTLPELQAYLNVDSILTVIDAEQILTLAEDNALLAVDQIEVADIVILNKVDRVTTGQKARVRGYITEIAPNARILETTFGQVPLELVLGVGQYDAERLAGRAPKEVHVHAAGQHADHEHDHSLVFSTWSWRSREPLSIPAVRDLVGKLPRSIYRAKAILYLSDFPYEKAVLQIVGKRASLSLGGPWPEGIAPESQLVVIGTQGSLKPDALQALCDEALAFARSHRGDGGIYAFELDRWG